MSATYKIRIRSTARCNYPCEFFLPLPARFRRSRCSRERSDASCWFSANAGCFRKAPSTVNSRLRSRQKYSLAADSELAFVKTSVTGLAGRFSYRVSFCGWSDNASEAIRVQYHMYDITRFLITLFDVASPRDCLRNFNQSGDPSSVQNRKVLLRLSSDG